MIEALIAAKNKIHEAFGEDDLVTGVGKNAPSWRHS